MGASSKRKERKREGKKRPLRVLKFPFERHVAIDLAMEGFSPTIKTTVILFCRISRKETKFLNNRKLLFWWVQAKNFSQIETLLFCFLECF